MVLGFLRILAVDNQTPRVLSGGGQPAKDGGPTVKALNDARLVAIFRRQLERGCVITMWDEWEPLVRQAHARLVYIAKQESLTAYSELARHIGIPTFPDYEWFPLKIAWVSGACSQYELEDGHPLISSLAINQDTGKPGAGYWGFSTMPSHLLAANWEDRRKSPPEYVEDERDEFWANEVKAVYRHWAGQ